MERFPRNIINKKPEQKVNKIEDTKNIFYNKSNSEDITNQKITEESESKRDVAKVELKIEEMIEKARAEADKRNTEPENTEVKPEESSEENKSETDENNNEDNPKKLGIFKKLYSNKKKESYKKIKKNVGKVAKWVGVGSFGASTIVSTFIAGGIAGFLTPFIGLGYASWKIFKKFFLDELMGEGWDKKKK